MKLLILSGTSDGNNLACELSKYNHTVIVTSTTDLGKFFASKFFKESKCKVKVLKKVFKNENDIIEFVKNQKIEMIIDCTHPFAENIKSILTQLQDQILIVRYERPKIEIGYLKAIEVSSFEQAAKACQKFKNIFLSIGSSRINFFENLIKSGKNIYARVLPTKDSIDKCLKAGIKMENLVLDVGPYTLEKNLEHFRKSQAEVVVSKDSGQSGGLFEKIKACEILEIPIIIIKPRENSLCNKFYSLNQIVEFVNSKTAMLNDKV
ncbi:MAG: precorrin-6A reductase [Fervidobacterium sp.]|nr:precorrin-6A reductase [Fervidobacterium sp.]